MSEVLRITNDGPRILTTNFWKMPMARQGYFFVSINAGTFRLLVPRAHEGTIRQMRTATLCVVSRGPCPELRLPDALEVLFDDQSASPFSLHLSAGQVDHWPLDGDAGLRWTLTVWRHRVGETAIEDLERPCAYRRSRQLPDLRPWR